MRRHLSIRKKEGGDKEKEKEKQAMPNILEMVEMAYLPIST